MTTIIERTKLQALIAAAFVTVSVSSQAVLPQGEFACQVQTVGGQSGLVLVQTDSRGDAEKAASSAMAWEMGGGRSKVISVVECIRTPAEKFKDTWFNKFYEEFPL